MEKTKYNEKLALAEKINKKFYELIEYQRGNRVIYPLTLKQQLLLAQDIVIDTKQIDNISRALLRQYWNEIKNI